VLKLPLRWPVLPNDAAASTAVQQDESFSLMAATQLNAGMLKNADFSKIYNSGQQPYANLTGKLEQQTSSNLFCSVAADRAKAYGIDCSNGFRKKDLRGKVVVIGAQSDQDYPSVLGAGMYGFELQARYVAALLSGSYLRDISPLYLLLLLAIYYALSELLIPYLHIHRHPPKPLFHIERPLAWSVGLYIALLVLAVTVPVLFHRFPPLGMLLGISSIMIPTLLVEAWELINEHTEDPEGDELA
jgi:CHASE2 domain-containing sensor protein